MFDFRINNKQYEQSQLTTITRYFYSFNSILKYNDLNNKNNNLFLTKEDIIKILDDNMKEILDIDVIKNIINKRVVTIPKGTYIVHGTDFILPSDKSSNYGFFELDENELNKENKLEVPKSFTFLNLPNESAHTLSFHSSSSFDKFTQLVGFLPRTSLYGSALQKLDDSSGTSIKNDSEEDEQVDSFQEKQSPSVTSKAQKPSGPSVTPKAQKPSGPSVTPKTDEKSTLAKVSKGEQGKGEGCE
jgi:hypothetical protein